ncbi:MAG: hypothetical protein KDA28_03080, partial [Phycisphaerales bacterium]|nr:hypothetical protein [Phycisphaerales bacterium]
ARILPDSPEVLLRLAAVRFADLDDHAGFQALVKADQMLRETPNLPSIEHLPLLEHEIRHPDEGPMMLGRIASGICLACASIPRERIPYVREDVMDDVRFSKWLVGRDPDRQLLDQVFRVLEGCPEDTRQAA